MSVRFGWGSKIAIRNYSELNMKFISSADQDISRVSKANESDILFNTRNNFIFPNIHVLFCLLYKKKSYSTHKNRAVNAFHDN